MTAPKVSSRPRRRRFGGGIHGSIANSFAVNGFALLMCVIALFPVLYMVLVALRPTDRPITGLTLFTDPAFTVENFGKAANAMPLWSSLANSAFTTVIGTVTTLFFCSLAGFAFAKFRFRGRNVLFVLILLTMLIPAEIGVVPLFVIMKNLGLVNSLWSLIIPRMATAVGIFYMRQYISTVPDEMIEAARIDGASNFRIYWSIILPVIKPALAIWATLTVLARWNDFFWPLVFLQTEAKHTLMLSLSLLPVAEGLSTPWPVIMAGTTIAVVPVIIVYLVLQLMQKGNLTEGAVKG